MWQVDVLYFRYTLLNFMDYMDEVEQYKEEKKLTEVTTEKKMGLGVKVLLLTIVTTAVVAGVLAALSLAK